MKTATMNTTVNAAPAIVKANKARRERMNRVDVALGKQANGKYVVNGVTYDSKTDACVAGRINVGTANKRMGEYGLSYDEATDFPRFSVMMQGNDRPSIPQAPMTPNDAATEAYWAVPLPTDIGLMTKKYGYDTKEGKWMDPMWKTKGKRGGRYLRYASFSQMCANHKRHKGFVLLCIELGMTLKEALEYSYQVPDELGVNITDPVLKQSFIAFSIHQAITKSLSARGMADRTSSINPRTIWKYMILDEISFEEALFKAIGEIGPKKTYKARFIGQEYGFTILHDGKYTSSYWVDPNTGRKFESFPKMCKCYATTPARVETALKKGVTLGTALKDTGLQLSRGAKEVF